MWGPMGWIIIGGLTAATVVTLGLVPALYVLVERRGAVEVTQSSEVEIGLEPLRHPI